MSNVKDNPNRSKRPIRRFDLVGRISGEKAIEFLQVEMLADRKTPFALVRYSDNGKEPLYGLRLDLDKRVFIDHLEDHDKDEMVTRAAITIAEYIGQKLGEDENSRN